MTQNNNNAGSQHWISQKLSAVALIPLSLFSIYKILTLFHNGSGFMSLFHTPFSLLIIILFVIFGLYHATLGIEVIYEDYIKCNLLRSCSNGLIKFINITTVALIIFALFYGFNKANTANIKNTNTELIAEQITQ